MQRLAVGGYAATEPAMGGQLESPRPYGSMHSLIVTLGFACIFDEDTAADSSTKRN